MGGVGRSGEDGGVGRLVVWVTIKMLIECNNKQVKQKQ